MSTDDNFNPYHIWLGIPPDEQPPSHYRLLGLREFESDQRVIVNAADRQMAHLRSFQHGPLAPLSQKLLNEIAAARVCLLNADSKRAYDQKIRKPSTAETPLKRPKATPPETPKPAITPSSVPLQPVVERAAIPSVKLRSESTRRKSHAKRRVPQAVLVAGGLVIVFTISMAIFFTYPGDQPDQDSAPQPESSKSSVASPKKLARPNNTATEPEPIVRNVPNFEPITINAMPDPPAEQEPPLANSVTPQTPPESHPPETPVPNESPNKKAAATLTDGNWHDLLEGYDPQQRGQIGIWEKLDDRLELVHTSGKATTSLASFVTGSFDLALDFSFAGAEPRLTIFLPNGQGQCVLDITATPKSHILSIAQKGAMQSAAAETISKKLAADRPHQLLISMRVSLGQLQLRVKLDARTTLQWYGLANDVTVLDRSIGNPDSISVSVGKSTLRLHRVRLRTTSVGTQTLDSAPEGLWTRDDILRGKLDLTEVSDSKGGASHAFQPRLSSTSRLAMVRSGGGTPESEQAVGLALQWLAEHQRSNGTWSFEHQSTARCNGECSNPGQCSSTIGATAITLLPFLGAGYTHREGRHSQSIDLGLKYLMRLAQAGGESANLRDDSGTMYAHGMAAMVLCEAYGMTRDPALRAPAQAAVNFIVFAQDPNAGGWRYNPHSPGDTSVSGWQLMALKTAEMAGLDVPSATLKKADKFFDSVQARNGAAYGYQNPDTSRPTMTAVGLLCRMYEGWTHDRLPLQQGVQTLAALGPSTDQTTEKNNLYHNYYVTQVMRHFGGESWRQWNTVMRDYLVKTQSKQGHESGSWFLPGIDHGAKAGGRLYCTAMATLILEVYYRHRLLYAS